MMWKHRLKSSVRCQRFLKHRERRVKPYYCAEEDEEDICTCDFDEVENCPVHYPIDDGSEDDDDE